MGLVSRFRGKPADGKSDSASGKPKDGKEEKPTGLSCLLDIICVITFVALLYTLVFSPREIAAHKKIMDEQILELGKLYTAHKAALLSQVDAMTAEKEALASSADAAAHPTETAAQIQHLEHDIEEKKAEVVQQEQAAAKFCEWCQFDANGLRTGCSTRRDYLMGRYGLDKEASNAAVMQQDPKCKMN